MNELEEFLTGINWVVSLIGAILLSILGNLLTTPVQHFLAKKSVKRSKKRAEELRAQLSQIEGYVNTPSTLYLFVVGMMVRTAVVTLVAFALSDMTLASINASVGLGRSINVYPEALYAASQFLTAVLYIVAVNYTFITLRIVNRVQHFPQYKAEIERAITSLTKFVSATTVEKVGG